MRPSRVLTACALAGAALATTAPAATAAPICRVVKVGDGSLVFFGVCIDAVVLSDGETFSGYVRITCSVPPYVADPKPCYGTTASFGPTGFVPNTVYRAPEIDPKTGSVRVYDGSLGTLYVDGRAFDVPIVGFCVGDPAFCA